MLPAVGMQLMAIRKRVGQYGITENRYFIGVLALWLLVVSAAGALNRLKSLKPLPLSLCIIALLSSFGPWGAYSVSRHSQVGRLEKVLAEAGLRNPEGRIMPVARAVDRETRRELSAILDYLMEQHGPGSVEALLTPDQNLTMATMSDSLHRRHERPELSRRFMEFMNLEHTPHWQHAQQREYYNFTRERDGDALPLLGFSQILPIEMSGNQQQQSRIGEQDMTLSREGLKILVKEGEQIVFTMPLDDLIAKLKEYEKEGSGRDVPDSLLWTEVHSDLLHMRLQLREIGWREANEGDKRLNRIIGFMLIDAESPPPH